MSQTLADEEFRLDGMARLGLGTWQNTDAEQCANSVRQALETGYRHVDTAQIYDNEAYVGEGLADADVPRDDVFLATKIWKSNLRHDDVIETAKESLDRLGVDYLDLLYIHWPSDEYAPEDTLPAFDQLREEGLIQNVGVSNFEPEHIDTARDVLDAPVFANQVEMHPFLQQDDLLDHCRRHDVNVVAYSPLARGRVFENETIQDIAQKHDASPAQVSLAWLLQRDGVAAIPKATGEEHIRDNFGALDVQLDEEDVEKIDGLDEHDREVDPDFAPW